MSARSLRIALVTSHPVQYQVPWLRLLAQVPGVDLTVYYAMLPDQSEQGREFGLAFAWDLPLLGGYRHVELRNVAAQPSVTEFRGCDTPGVGALLRAGRFDAVIVNGWVVKSCVQAWMACKLAGIPCIVRGEVNGLRERGWVKRAGHRLLLRSFDAVLTIGIRNREYCRLRGVPDDRLFATPYCIDNRQFADSARRWLDAEGRAGLRARFGLHDSKATFVFSGKLVEKKRPADLIEALRRSHAQGGAAQALIVGGGALEAELRERSADLPIRFCGFLNQSEIAAAYAAADCLVLPSDAGETWGLVVNEAMACGLPALVSDLVGCAADLVEDGVTGGVYRCGDVAALSDRIRASTPSGLAAMGAAARSRVHDGYCFERVVEGVLAAVESVRGR